jgi:mono/diheme cytochrome c family protein
MPPGVQPQPIRAPGPVTSNIPLPAGLLTFDAEQKEYTAKPGEVNCPFVFTVTNISPAEISITFIQTSCGCTTAATKLPIQIASGATAEIPINMNVLGKNGTVIKTVTVHTDKGHKLLMVKSHIPQPPADPAITAMNRERNQQLAQADRQAVFKGDCARCHVEPVVGKMGKELFTAACGICHEAEHRATMVPDLHVLKVTPNAEYWKFFVTHGKPATLMPAFAQSQGGPLSDLQIASLVEYLVKDFPTTKTNAPTHAHAH